MKGSVRQRVTPAPTAPDVAAAGFGVTAPGGDPFLAVKGVRDVGTGLVILALLVAGQRRALGWVMTSASIIPFGDMTIVLAGGDRLGVALPVHGAPGVVVLAVGIALLWATRVDRTS